MLIDELLAYLFDGRPHPLAAPMATWLGSSRRFAAFATSFHNKIRKKLRAIQEQESLQDLRLELETAYLLLQERSLSLAYEPPHCGQARCPDFAVTYTTSLTFMVEVTRLRPVGSQAKGTSQPDTGLALPLVADRIADAVCSKLGQLLPRHSNVLLVGVEGPCPTQEEIHTAMLRVQQRAERNDSTLFQQHRFRDRSDFFRHYQRLSEILVRGPQLQADETLVVWGNPQAKYPLPGKVRTALHHSHGA